MKVLLSLFLILMSASAEKPNVLLICIDDMNNDISLFGENKPYKTPAIRSLAKRGTFFSRAYCSSPACNPSRASMLTGLRPHLTGVYANNTDWRTATKGHLTIPEYFEQQGYYTAGYGKIYHHHGNGAYNDPEVWSEFKKMDKVLRPSQKLNGSRSYGSRSTDWGRFPEDDQEKETVDWKSVTYAIDVLKRKHDKPFFLACGIYKPHSPFYAPPKYHLDYSGKVKMPLLNENDWDDLPSGADKLLEEKKWFWTGMTALDKQVSGSYRKFIEAYAACCAFADSSVSRLINALDKSEHASNTIIVIWSDHGFHLGEKDHIEKFALWEKTNHIPFIIVDPRSNRKGETCSQPIDMTIVFPTLLEMCGLPKYEKLHGRSAASLVKNSSLKWDEPALMTYGFNNHAVRSENWRYIRYADGSEELYDHTKDPHEWENLAGKPEFIKVIESHRKWIPTKNVELQPSMKRKK